MVCVLYGSPKAVTNGLGHQRGAQWQGWADGGG